MFESRVVDLRRSPLLARLPNSRKRRFRRENLSRLLADLAFDDAVFDSVETQQEFSSGERFDAQGATDGAVLNEMPSAHRDWSLEANFDAVEWRWRNADAAAIPSFLHDEQLARDILLHRRREIPTDLDNCAIDHREVVWNAHLAIGCAGVMRALHERPCHSIWIGW